MKKAFFITSAVAILSMQSCRSDDDFIAAPVLAASNEELTNPVTSRPVDSVNLPRDSSAIKDPIPPRKDPIQWMTPEELRQKLIEALRRLAQ